MKSLVRASRAKDLPRIYWCVLSEEVLSKRINLKNNKILKLACGTVQLSFTGVQLRIALGPWASLGNPCAGANTIDIQVGIGPKSVGWMV